MPKQIRSVLAVFVAGFLTAIAAMAAEMSTSAGTSADRTAQVTVTVRSRQQGRQADVNPDDVVVYEENQSRPVVSWVATMADPAPLDLTLLVDDSITSNIGLQFKDLSDFFPTLPAGTRVRIAYADYGGGKVVQDFTTDYQLATRALRLPQGATMAGGSVYQSVEEVVKKWPQDGNRRCLLLISDGLDINRGTSIESQADQNPDLQAAIDSAQKSGVTIYTLFAQGPRSLEGSLYLLNNGQGCLLRLSTETGGQSYFQGTLTPLDFSPYLKQFVRDLHHQYVLTFQTLASSHSGYQRLHVTTQRHGVELSAPTRIYVPADAR